MRRGCLRARGTRGVSASWDIELCVLPLRQLGLQACWSNMGFGGVCPLRFWGRWPKAKASLSYLPGPALSAAGLVLRKPPSGDGSLGTRAVSGWDFSWSAPGAPERVGWTLVARALPSGTLEHLTGRRDNQPCVFSGEVGHYACASCVKSSWEPASKPLGSMNKQRESARCITIKVFPKKGRKKQEAGTDSQQPYAGHFSDKGSLEDGNHLPGKKSPRVLSPGNGRGSGPPRCLNGVSAGVP